MNLDELIADAKKRAKSPKAPKKRTSREGPSETYYKTQEELRQMKLDACVPEAIVLRYTTQLCECGEKYHSMNSVPLVRRVSDVLMWHEPMEDSLKTMSEYNHLPRYLEHYHVEIPWCETCFANASHVEVSNG